MTAAIYHLARRHRDHREDRQHLAPRQAEAGEAIDPCPEQNREERSRAASRRRATTRSRARARHSAAPIKPSSKIHPTQYATCGSGTVSRPKVPSESRNTPGSWSTPSRRFRNSGEIPNSPRSSPRLVAPHQRQDDGHGQSVPAVRLTAVAALRHSSRMPSRPSSAAPSSRKAAANTGPIGPERIATNPATASAANTHAGVRARSRASRSAAAPSARLPVMPRTARIQDRRREQHHRRDRGKQAQHRDRRAVPQDGERRAGSAATTGAPMRPVSATRPC